jgi:hypothetical protein
MMKELPFVTALAALAENRFSLDIEFIFVRLHRPGKGKFRFPSTETVTAPHPRDFVNAVMNVWAPYYNLQVLFYQLSNCYPLMKNVSIPCD